HDRLTGHSTTAITDHDRHTPLHPHNAAYIIYTSGSTGTPKGVVMHQCGLANLLACQSQLFPGDHIGVVAEYLSVGFDFSVQEILASVCLGGCLLIPDDDIRLDAGVLAKWLVQQRVETLFGSMSALDTVLSEYVKFDDRSMRQVIQGGELLTHSRSMNDYLASPGTLVNVYGPAETHAATAFVRTSTQPLGTKVPIGRALSGVRVYVLDSGLGPVAPGVVGELYISGLGVTRGYL
ncbi:AMP-binding protein, partial [Mycolicibacterium baixiangningiae]